MTTDLTPAERAQWREDAGYINAHAGLYLPETSTLAWRILAVLAELDAAEAERDVARSYSDADTETASQMASRAFAAEAERDRLREQVAAAEALAEQWVENARRADATADARAGLSDVEDLRRYANGRRADAATLLLAIGGQIDQQDGGGER
jgi:hypothetical protein